MSHYYNNSNRNLSEAYEQKLEQDKDFEAKAICEEMGRTTKKTSDDVSNKLSKLLAKLDEYEDNITEDPERFKNFIANIKKERETVRQAKLLVMDMSKTLKKLDSVIGSFQMDF